MIELTESQKLSGKKLKFGVERFCCTELFVNDCRGLSIARDILRCSNSSPESYESKDFSCRCPVIPIISLRGTLACLSFFTTVFGEMRSLPF